MKININLKEFLIVIKDIFIIWFSGMQTITITDD